MIDRTGNLLIVAILIGMILGVVAVAIFGESASNVAFLGDIFLNALKMVVIPLLFCSMIVGITNLGDIRKLGRTGLKTIAYFLVTSGIAVVIGMILVSVIQPGVGFPTAVAQAPETVGPYSFFGWLAAQVPANIIKAAAETKVLPIIVVAIILGGVLSTMGSKGKPVITLIDTLNEAIMKIVYLIMWFAPIGIFGLVAGQLTSIGGIGELMTVLASLGKYSLVVVLGLAIHGIIVLPLILYFMAGRNPLEYFKGMLEALTTAFATASSSATLPVTLDCVGNKNDVDKRAASFVLPLGATINMDGTALYEAVAAIFIAQAYSVNMGGLEMLTIFAVAILASVGAAGIPQAGLVTMVLVLQAVGLPLEGIGLILAIDWLLDRFRTTVNVWGDSIGAAWISTTSEIALVDRRKLRRDRRQTSKSDSSRKRVTGDKDTQKPKQGQSDRDKTPSGGHPKTRKTGGLVERINRRPIGRERPDRSDDRRDRGRLNGDKREKFRMSDTKEVYRPADSAPTRVEMPQANKAPEKTFTKRESGQRPHHQRTNRKFDDARSSRPADNNTAKTNPAESESPEKVRDFVIPKFPDKILDELASSPSSHEEFVPKSAEKPNREDSRYDRNGDRPELTERVELPKQITSETGEVMHSDKIAEESASDFEPPGDSDENSQSDEFTKLDKMILGSSESEEIAPVMLESDDENDSPDENISLESESVTDEEIYDSDLDSGKPAISEDNLMDAPVMEPEDESAADENADDQYAGTSFFDGKPETQPESESEPDSDSYSGPDPESTTPFQEESLEAGDDTSSPMSRMLEEAGFGESNEEEASEEPEGSNSKEISDDDRDKDSADENPRQMWGRNRRKKK